MKEYYTNPSEIITARVLVVCDDNFLALRRTSNHNHNSGNELPGGKIDPGESIEQGLKRELNEEANIEIVINHEQLFFLNERTITDGNKYLGSTIKLYGSYLLVDQRPEIKLSSEHDDFRWISLSQIDQTNITPDSLTCINSFLAYLI